MKKSSASSRREGQQNAKRRRISKRPRNAPVMPSSANEMEYEPPKEVDFKSGIVLKGARQWRQFLSFKRGWVKLDPAIRQAFPTDEAVNRALRKAIKQKQSIGSAVGLRKSA